MRHIQAVDIRERIEQRLAELGLSVRGASLAAGMGETTLRNYLKNMTNSLTVESVEKLAPVLKVSPRWILFGESAEVVNIWDRIPADQQRLALDILTQFAQDK